VGADRKGPLAAFIVVAVIAVILLVTSVRSQAAPGWIQGRLPASIVAAVPDAPAPGVWDAVGQVVEQGVVLVHRATDDPGTTSGATPTTGEPVTTAAVTPSSGATSATAGGPTTLASTPPARAGSQRAGAPHAAAASDQTRPGHGRHLGWVHAHHGHGHGHGHGLEPYGQGHGLHLGWTRGP
jgi:hypothetical protein